MNTIYYSKGILPLVDICNKYVEVLPSACPYLSGRHSCKLRPSHDWFFGAQNKIVGKLWVVVSMVSHICWKGHNHWLQTKKIDISRKVEVLFVAMDHRLWLHRPLL